MKKTKLDLILNWKYAMILSLSNSKIQLKEFKDDILIVRKLFNQECMSSANVKQITSCVIDEDNNLLMITLESMNKLPVPIRGIRLFSQKLMTILQEKRGKEFVENMIKRKSIFRMLSVEEINNFKLQKSEAEDKESEFTIVTNDLYGIDDLKKKTFAIIDFYLNCLKEEKNLLKNKELINNNFESIGK